MSGKDLDLTIRGHDEASDDIRAVKRSTGDLTDATEKQTEAAQDMSLKYTEMLSALTLAKQGVEALKKVYEFAREGAALERLEQSSHELAKSMGVDMDNIVDAVSRASRGTISDWDIMAAANKMMLLGVTTDADEMAKVMWSAMERGRAMGRTTMEAFNDIAVGVGRASPLILDNLGYVFDAVELYTEYAATLGKTADALTETEEKQALLNMVIGDAKKPTEDAAEEMERFEVALDKAEKTGKIFLMETLLPIIEGFNTFVEGQAPVEDALRTHIRSIIEADWAYKDVQTEMRRLQDLLPGHINVWAIWNDELAKSKRAAEGADDALGDLKLALEDLLTPTSDLNVATANLKAALLAGKPEEAAYWAWRMQKIKEEEAALQRLLDLYAIPVGPPGTRKGHQPYTPEPGAGSAEGEKVWDSRSGAQGGWWYHNFATGGWSRTRNYAEGGKLADVSLVGEEGAELIINDVVIPADETRKLLALGLEPDASRQRGGSRTRGVHRRPRISPSVAGFIAANIESVEAAKERGSFLLPGMGTVGTSGGAAATTALVEIIEEMQQASAAETVVMATAAAAQVADVTAEQAIMQLKETRLSNLELIGEMRLMRRSVEKLNRTIPTMTKDAIERAL